MSINILIDNTFFQNTFQATGAYRKLLLAPRITESLVEDSDSKTENEIFVSALVIKNNLRS